MLWKFDLGGALYIVEEKYVRSHGREEEAHGSPTKKCQILHGKRNEHVPTLFYPLFQFLNVASDSLWSKSDYVFHFMTRLYLRGYIDITLDDESNALLSAFIAEYIVS